MQLSHFIIASLAHMGHMQFTHACGNRPRAPTAQGRHRDAGGHQEFDAVTVAHVEHLERLAARCEIQAPVGEYAVDVQDQELDPCQRRRPARLQTTPARNRSCTLSAPTIFSSASTTINEVMRWVSMRCTASAASVAGRTVFAWRLMTWSMRVVR